MTVKLRPYQSDLKRDIYAAWQVGYRNVLAVAPTGAGKTTTFASIMHEHNGASVAIVHRQELVGQISLALARNGVRHRILGQPSTIRNCVSVHLSELGRSYYDANARHAVAGVGTLIRMRPDDAWFASVGLWVQDEVHHLTAGGQWADAIAMFPNARGLGVTATPVRLDGKGLGRHADGFMDVIVEAPTMRELIAAGYLSEYRIVAPPSDIDLSAVGLTAGGDYSPDPLRKAVHASHITGDIVQHYLRFAPGKTGVTFCVDVEHATEVAAAFRAAGVPAEVVTAKTPDVVRATILRRAASGEIKQLVNCALFDEGFDLPAIEVVCDAAPTMSFSRVSQRFGRMLRLSEGKTHGIYIDHTGNITVRHGLPDAPRTWTLDRREKRGKSRPTDTIAVRTCPKCMGVYERAAHGLTCPYCGEVSQPVSRGAPEHVDGDLFELDADTLARMRGEVDAAVKYHPDRVVQMTLDKRHREKVAAQELLRDAMAAWAGARDSGTDEATVRRLQREFYQVHGIDVLSAMALGAREAEELTQRLTTGS
jgi:superfamily II DNA or RNA helicase